jgi:hypothetical protein
MVKIALAVAAAAAVLIDDRLCGSDGLDGGVRSQIRTGLRYRFPANREINRVFSRFSPPTVILRTESRCAAATCRQVP